MSEENLRRCAMCYAGIKTGYTCSWPCLQRLRTKKIKIPAPVVYLISSIVEFPDMVKIGYSDNVEVRLRELQTGSPVILDILWCFPGSYQLESYLHGVFHKSRKHGEWFCFPDGNVIDLVCDVLPDF